jgi:hypothetical protein
MTQPPPSALSRSTYILALCALTLFSSCQSQHHPSDTSHTSPSSPSVASSSASNTSPDAANPPTQQTTQGGAKITQDPQNDSKKDPNPDNPKPDTDATGAPSVATSPPPSNPLTKTPPPSTDAPIYGLSFVPEDTPYIFAMLHPLPYDQWPWQLETFAPFIDEFRRQLKQNPHLANEQETRLILSYLKAFDGKLSPEGLESLGFDLNTQMIIYGVGLLPVMRVELKDGAKVMALIEQVEKDSGLSLTRATVDGLPYLTFEFPSSSSIDPSSPPDPSDTFSISFAIQENTLIATASPPSARDALMRHLLAPLPPSFASFPPQKLLDITTKHHRSPRPPLFAGAIRTHETLQVLSGGGSALSHSIMTAAGMTSPPLSPPCLSDLNLLSLWLPQISMVGDSAKNFQEFNMVIELNDPALLAEIMLWRQPTPGLGLPAKSPTSRPPLLTFSIGLDIPRMLSTLKARATALSAMSFSCEFLQKIPVEAASFAREIDVSALPAELTSSKGLNLRLLNIKLDASGMPSAIEAVVVLLSDKPAHIWGLLSALDPTFSKPLPADGTPQAITPPSMLSSYISALYAAMTPSLLGVAIGKGHDASLSELLASPSSADAPIFSFSYDYGRFMALFAAFAPDFGSTAGTLFQNLRWFITFDLGVNASGLYMRTSLDSTKH